MPRYDYDDGNAEREPLDNAYRAYTRSPNPPEPYRDHQQYYNGPPPSYPQQQDSGGQQHPVGHPDFARMREERRNDRHGVPQAAAVGAVGGAAAGYGAHQAGSHMASPQVPPHRDWAPDRYSPPQQSNLNPNVTPGADNFSDSASGGMAGIAYSVAERNARESVVDAMRNVGQAPPRGQFQQPNVPPQPFGSPHGEAYEMSNTPRPYATSLPDRKSHSSLTALGGAAASPARLSPSASPYGYNEYGSDNTYYRTNADHLSVVDPDAIADDGDDGLEYGRKSGRNSMLSLSNNSDRTGHSRPGAAAVAGAGAATALMAGAGRTGKGGGFHDPLKGSALGSNIDLGAPHEKPSDWRRHEDGKRKKWKWCIILAVVLVFAGAIAGGLAGWLVGRNNRDGGGGGGHQGQSADDDNNSNGDLNADSQEIKDLMNNQDLHKVFPGMDYTPINTQYPDCIHDPPSQNNVTRDLAVLSQLTNTIRLYGTDCNQTQMVIHSIQQLKLEGTVKIWMGVWQDNNETTNARQLQQMWDILDQYGDKHFEGVIVANEILFRQEMTESSLGTLLQEVRTNLTAKQLTLPVATSDLGDDWTASLASKSDYIMANIHPFFAGVNAKDAASWTYTFWENKASGFFKSDPKKNVIAEVGWPSKGGTNCGNGQATGCPDASVAGIDEMNELLDKWVCPALTNGTSYFWFSAFDEPWKIRFDEPNKEWEDQWGLMDVNRRLKTGVKIPDCGGKTV